MKLSLPLPSPPDSTLPPRRTPRASDHEASSQPYHTSGASPSTPGSSGMGSRSSRRLGNPRLIRRARRGIYCDIPPPAHIHSRQCHRDSLNSHPDGGKGSSESLIIPTIWRSIGEASGCLSSLTGKRNLRGWLPGGSNPHIPHVLPPQT
jgi:hypothetical protein